MNDERTLEEQCYGECWAAKEQIADRDAEIERLRQINQSHEMKLSVRGYEIQIDSLKADIERLKAERDEAVKAEREACAAIADKYLNETGILTVKPAKSAAAHLIAIAIRARGSK
jgi:hypothetical protein